MCHALDTLSTVLLDVVHLLPDLRDVFAFVSALPQLPPALEALLQLRQSMDLTRHWPCLHLENLAPRNIGLGIIALPAFPHVSVGPATNLRWLAAPLPRSTRVRLPLRSRTDTTLAFAQMWGDRVHQMSVAKHAVYSAQVLEIRDLCRHVETIMIRLSSPASAALWVSALTQRALSSCSFSLEIPPRPNAPLADRNALAQTILSTSSLAILKLNDAPDIQMALAASDGNLHHVTHYAMSNQDSATTQQTLLDKLNPAKVVNLSVSGPVDVSRFWALRHLLVSHGTLDCSKLGTSRCHDLRSVSFDRQVSDFDMETIVQWVTTSRVLKSFYAGTVGNLGFEAIARTLPVWIAHGLEEVGLGHPWNFRPIPSSKQRLLLLADALATERDRRKPLKVYVDLGKRALDYEEMDALLVAVGASSNVSLTLDSVTGYPRGKVSAFARVEATRHKVVMTYRR